ncbi:MAG: aspartate kinase [Christensenellales bacterium]
MELKVAKFGGSSLADAAQFEKVAAIIKADPRRVYVVPSAPGKRSYTDTKVTDMLYTLHQTAEDGEDITQPLKDVQERFEEIITGLGLDYDISGEFEIIRENLLAGASADYIASRGEYLSGLVLSRYIGYTFIDPATCIFFDEHGVFDQKTTDPVLREVLKSNLRAVIPGFYGALRNGEVKTFSRGGSDITGSIVARAAQVALYENWTDVSGFLMCDPCIVRNPRIIRSLTYHELRELSYMGATVLHEEAIFPVRQVGIPINVRNTNNPCEKGTMIVRYTPDEDAAAVPITGIAGKKNFLAITIEKDMMNAQIGFGRKLLSVLENHGVSFEHMPSGIDTISLVIDEKAIAGKLDAVLKDIRKECEPDLMDVTHDLALIAIVGHAMQYRIGLAAKVLSALSAEGVNIRMLDQGSSEVNIIIGVQEKDFETAIRAIYTAFVPEEASE